MPAAGPRSPRAWSPRPPGGALRLRMGRRWRSRSGDETPAGKGGGSRPGPHRRLCDFGFDLPGDELIPRYNRLRGDRKNGCSAICVAMGTIAGGARAWKNTAFVGGACHSARGPSAAGAGLSCRVPGWGGAGAPGRTGRRGALGLGVSPKLRGRTLALTLPAFGHRQACSGTSPSIVPATTPHAPPSLGSGCVSPELQGGPGSCVPPRADACSHRDSPPRRARPSSRAAGLSWAEILPQRRAHAGANPDIFPFPPGGHRWARLHLLVSMHAPQTRSGLGRLQAGALSRHIESLTTHTSRTRTHRGLHTHPLTHVVPPLPLSDRHAHRLLLCNTRSCASSEPRLRPRTAPQPVAPRAPGLAHVHFW